MSNRRRSVTMTIRVTEEERMEILGRMLEAVAPSLTEFIIAMCRDGKIVVNEELKETHRKLEQTISLAGRMQEESTSKISAAAKTEVQKMDGLVSSLSLRMTKFLIGTAVASVLLSVLVCVVLWLSVV